MLMLSCRGSLESSFHPQDVRNVERDALNSSARAIGCPSCRLKIVLIVTTAECLGTDCLGQVERHHALLVPFKSQT